ncbi:type II toxin-antitoxin system RelE/ParE family toxin [Rhizobium sp.]
MIDWLTEAQIEFRHHIAYIHQHNPRAASRIQAQIIRRVALLERFPRSGRIGRQQDSRELVVTGTPYIVIYAVAGDVIQIMHVVHTSQQWPPED